MRPPLRDDYLHLSPPHLEGRERQLLLDALDSNWVAPAGPDLAAFEAETASVVGRRHAVALASGTGALHLALLTMGVGAGDEVLVPSFTFAATANAVCHTGAAPVFLDSAADTWTVDPGLIEDELARRARRGTIPAAVVPVDLYGQCADYDTILEICARHGVPVVADAAESLGSRYRGQPAGSFGSAAVLSFNGNKIVTTGGGGMVVTDDATLADHVRYLSTQARDPVPHYEHRTVGYNYRLSNLLAAVGRGQLHALEARVKARRRTNEAYREVLSGVPGLEFMPMAAYGDSNCWLTCILVDAPEFGATRDEVRLHLQACGIESRPTWKPMHCQPAFHGHRMLGGAVSEDLFNRGLCLPSGSALTDGDRERVVKAILTVPR